MQTVIDKKYRVIAEQILAGIRGGEFPVGAQLPTETRLMEAYGVSRHTVRSAIQELRNRGFIESRQGSGSIVIAQEGQSAFVERIQSIDELIQFGRGTTRRLIGRREITADAHLSEIFGSPAGRRLLEVDILRAGKDRPDVTVAYAQVWFDPLFVSLVDDLERENRTIAELFDTRFRRRTGAVRQRVSAGPLDAAMAKAMQRTPGECALKIERRYAEHPDGPAFLRTLSYCIAELVTVESHFLSG